MSTKTAYLALLLDAPMQSWGFESRFQRRATGLQPTKSGIIGMICAAMGLAKGSAQERATLPTLAQLKMTSIAIPRRRRNLWSAETEEVAVARLEDFHTVLGTRRASGSVNPDPVVTRRQYLVDARFGVVLEGDHTLLERVAAALQNPVWGVWLGRKSCPPAEAIYRGLFATQSDAQRELIGDTPLEALTVVTEVERFDEGTDSLSDQPVSFGDSKSSGPDKRQFAPRRIKVQPGIGLSAKE
jgi:CRISPR system Cascade subunit CasD